MPPKGSWHWRMLEVENQDYRAPQLWCYPACKVRSILIYNSYTHAHRLLLLINKLLIYSNYSLFPTYPSIPSKHTILPYSQIYSVCSYIGIQIIFKITPAISKFVG